MNELFFPPFNKSSRLFTVNEVAEIMRCHPRTVCRWARTGQLAGAGAFQVAGKRGGWRFKRKEFIAWWEAQTK
jgi:excisionase family DNA binding protein